MSKSIFEKESKYENAKWWQKLFYTWTFDVIAASKERKLNKDDFGGMKEEDTINEKVKEITEAYDK